MTASTSATPDLDPLVDALGPVRSALLEDAAREADRIVNDAAHDAESIVDEAEADARAEVRRAEERSEMSARARADRMLARARNDSHHEILRAKEDIRHRLLEAVHAAALALREDPRYPDLLTELVRLARDQLGPDAVFERDPADHGGILVTDGSHRLDYTLPALADRALDVLADDVAELWR